MMDRIDANMEDGLAAAAAGTTSSNYLGDPAVVDQLVRDFMSSCVSINVDFQGGEIDEGEAGEKLVELSKRYASIFLGESKAYVPMPWNSPRRLDFYVRAMQPPHLEDYERATDAYFAAIGTAVIQIAMRIDKNEVLESEGQQAITEMRDDMVRAMLGTRDVAHAG